MWLVPFAFAAVPEADRFVATDRVAVGVAEDGSFGNSALDVALLGDVDGPEGPVPVGGDWLAWGYTFEGWTVAWADGLDANFAAYGTSSVPLAWDPPGEGSLAWLHGAGATEAYTIETWVATPWDAGVVWLTTTITATTAMDGVEVLRAFDPDPDTWSTGSYDAAITVDGDVATAASPTDGRAVALAGADGEAGWCGWCTDPADLEVGAWSGVSDDQAGVRVSLGDLAPGDHARVSIVYAFDVDATAAAARARGALADPDPDGDGVDGDADCAPWDDRVGGGLPERADGLDNDCDGAVDEDLPVTGDPLDTGWAPEVGSSAPGTQTTIGDCATASAPPWLGLLALAALRRRSR